METIKMINLNTLTTEQKLALKEELKSEELAAKKQKRDDRDAYKGMMEDFVHELFPLLENFSQEATQLKWAIFERAKNLLALKEIVYGIKDNQASHAFTDTAGRTIRIGHRTKDAYDDTIGSGIAKVKGYLEGVQRTKENEDFVEAMMIFLKTDRDGNLNPGRVMELQNWCEKRGNPETLKDGMDIIRNAYKPSQTCKFVEAYYKDVNGKEVNIPLSMSAL
ncbi:MAG: DUF3164 family protein [Bacteroidales bacterium]